MFSSVNWVIIDIKSISRHNLHDDVIKWKHFPCYWTFVRGIHWSLVNSPHKGRWCGALMFSLICAWTNGWVNSWDAGDLRCHCTHYDVTVMEPMLTCYHLGPQKSTSSFLLHAKILSVKSRTNLFSSNVFIHRGRVMHICISKLTIIGSDNGLSLGWCHAIIWTDAGILSIGPLETNFGEILINIHTFSLNQMHLKISGKWRPCCLSLSVFILLVLKLEYTKQIRSIS